MMNYTQDERAFIWLCACTGLEYRQCVALLRAAGSPSDLFENWEKFSREVIKEGRNRLYNISRTAREKELNAFLERIAEQNYFIVTLCTDDYPDDLKAIPAPPLVLYGAGNRALLKKKKFCIVGSRLTPPWAEKQAGFAAKQLSEKFVIVTGLAEGGDSAAISGALPGGNLICVLPNGLNVCYPAAHLSLKEKIRQKGLLLSEYPPDEPLRKYNFHARNRILAGLSKGTLIVSAGVRSGALITAHCSVDYGREVFAFPYNPGISQGAGCNELIKKGAYLATGADDIFFSFGIEPMKRVQAALSEQEERVVTLLREEGELHAAVIAERTNIPIYEITAILAALEMKNLAVKAGGNRYSAT